MQNCKKYRPNTNDVTDHHRNPQGNCQSCVYFTTFNCGNHIQEIDSGFVG